jgi:hypothetical protein
VSGPVNPPRAYLGDSVYVAFDRGMIRLTTEDGRGPGLASNTIYLEPSVYFALVAWAGLPPDACRAAHETPAKSGA